MHLFRRSAAFSLAVLALLSLFPAVAVAQARAVSLEELVRASNSIILGRTLGQESFWEDGGKRIMTRVRMAVDETVVGESAAEAEILVPGGRVGDTVYEVSDMPTFVDGEEVLVFVWTSPDGRNLVTGGLQGRMDVVRDEQGRRMVRGLGHLVRSEESPGRVAPETRTGDARPSRAVPLETVLERIRSARN